MSLRLTAVAVLVVTALLVLGIAGASPAAARGCAFSDARPGSISEPTLRHATLCLLNRERARRGMRRLHQDRRLMKAGRGHVRDMVRRGYFAHTSIGGSTFVKRVFRTGYFAGAHRWAVGENLAWGSGSRSTPRRVVRSWLGSPPHRHNLFTRKWREVGVGITRGTPRGRRDDGATYATEFAVRN